MIRRPTLVILAIFIVLLGVAYYLQRNPLPSTSNATSTPQPALLPNVEESKIAKIEFTDKDGHTVTLGRDEKGVWALTQPQEPTDVSKAEALISQLVDLKILNTLASAPPGQATGLETPADTITVNMNGGDQYLIKLGSPIPTGSGYYLTVNDGPVLVVSKYGVESVVGIISNPPVQATATPEVAPTLEATGPAATSVGTPQATPTP
jgi:hypothetical protein